MVMAIMKLATTILALDLAWVQRVIYWEETLLCHQYLIHHWFRYSMRNLIHRFIIFQSDEDKLVQVVRSVGGYVTRARPDQTGPDSCDRPDEVSEHSGNIKHEVVNDYNAFESHSLIAQLTSLLGSVTNILTTSRLCFQGMFSVLACLEGW